MDSSSNLYESRDMGLMSTGKKPYTRDVRSFVDIFQLPGAQWLWGSQEPYVANSGLKFIKFEP